MQHTVEFQYFMSIRETEVCKIMNDVTVLLSSVLLLSDNGFRQKQLTVYVNVVQQLC